MDINTMYERWLKKAEDKDIHDELLSVKDDADAIRDRFYRSLEFGTGGLRGVIGAGTNRMNIYTVALATQALVNYLKHRHVSHPKVVIGYDSRIKSTDFAKAAAAVLAENGVHAYLHPQLVPTPVVSFSVRHLGCDAGICITASHNPSIYNGFKCYGSDGCQMTDDDAGAVSACMDKLDIFTDVRHGNFDALLEHGKIEYVSGSVREAYVQSVLSASINTEVCAQAGLSVVYTPLCGAGNRFVRDVLDRAGVSSVTVVAEQEQPDGTFPGCPYPNPEIREAFTLSLEYAQRLKPDLLLATDPDSDRVGIAVRNGDDYVLVSGNDVGALLVDYVINSRTANGTMPANPVVIKSIVTSDLGKRIAESHGCECRNVLTGFKYIGEQMTGLSDAGQDDRFLMGWEESYGYLIGTHARDKDAVVASLLICEMASYYKMLGKSLLDVLDEIFRKYGYFRHRLCNYTFTGESGSIRMNQIMDGLRAAPRTTLGGMKVVARFDYLESTEYLENGETRPITLPKSNVLSYILEDGSSLVVRPSGTEPKMKIYLAAVGETAEAGDALLDLLEKDADAIAE